jgi:hypothetical protein
MFSMYLYNLDDPAANISPDTMHFDWGVVQFSQWTTYRQFWDCLCWATTNTFLTLPKSSGLPILCITLYVTAQNIKIDIFTAVRTSYFVTYVAETRSINKKHLDQLNIK